MAHMNQLNFNNEDTEVQLACCKREVVDFMTAPAAGSQ